MMINITNNNLLNTKDRLNIHRNKHEYAEFQIRIWLEMCITLGIGQIIPQITLHI